MTDATRPAERVLGVEGLVVEYRVSGHRTLRAVDDVSLELGRGEVLGVVGESGSGKTTLGRTIAGFVQPTSGRVLLPSADGGLRERSGTRGHRDVQMIFQESAAALNPRLPVWKVIGEAFEPASSLQRRRGALRELVAEQLTRVGLPESFVDRPARLLSGGEKQRVAIARAFAARPVAMVCDEAVSALDVSIRAVVLNLFQRLRVETGTSLLFISHDIAVVSHLADRVMVMHNGRAVEEGATRDVVERPQAEYTRRLIDAVPRLERAA